MTFCESPQRLLCCSTFFRMYVIDMPQVVTSNSTLSVDESSQPAVTEVNNETLEQCVKSAES